MPTIISRRQKENKINDTGAKLPAYQSLATLGITTQYVVPIQPPPNPNALQKNTQIYMDLEEFEVAKIDKFCIKFTITATSDTKLLPVFYWFREIEIRAQKGAGDVLQRIYPENIYLYYWLTMNEEERQIWSELSNFSIHKDPITKRESIYTDEKNIIRAGETRDIYMLVPATFLQNSFVNMRHLISELRIQAEVSNDIVLQGDFALENIEFVILSFMESSTDSAARMNIDKSHNHKFIYLDCERLTYNNNTLASNTRKRFNLDQFQNKSPFLFCVYKPSTAPTGTDKYKFLELPNSGTIDFENSGGKSILGQGTPIHNREIFKEYVEQTGNHAIKGGYLINFSEHIQQALAGVIQGMIQFDGSNHYLVFEYGNEAIPEIQTIQAYNPGTSASDVITDLNGAMKFETEEKNSHRAALTYTSIDSGLANVANYLNASLLNNAEQTIASSTANLGSGNIVLTFDARDGNVSDRLGTIGAKHFSPTNPFKDYRTELTQRGKDGWVSSSDYTLEIFCYKYKEIIIGKNGVVSCREI